MRRDKREDRTVEAYMHAGAMMRILKCLYADTVIEIGTLCGYKASNRLRSGYSVLTSACADVEECMFADHENLPDDFLNVFYGVIDIRRDNDTDRETRRIMHEILTEMAERVVAND